MHELGVVLEILELVGEIKEEQELKEISSITVDVGELSGILPDYFADCWRAARIGSEFENTELVLNVIKATARCVCGCEYELNTCGRVCPECKKTDYEIIGGRQFMVRQIEAC